MPIKRNNESRPIILASQRKQKVRAPLIISSRIDQPQLRLVIGRLVAGHERQTGAAVGIVVVGHAVARLRVDDLDVVCTGGVDARGLARVAGGRVVGAGIEVQRRAVAGAREEGPCCGVVALKRHDGLVGVAPAASAVALRKQRGSVGFSGEEDRGRIMGKGKIEGGRE